MEIISHLLNNPKFLLILAAFNLALSPAMIVGIPVMIINILQLNDAALGLGGYVLTADRPSAFWRPAGPTIPSAGRSPKLSTSKAPFRRIQRQEGAFHQSVKRSVLASKLSPQTVLGKISAAAWRNSAGLVMAGL